MSKPCKTLAFNHHVMSPLRSKLLSSSTLSSLGFLLLMLESVFSSPTVQLQCEYQFFLLHIVFLMALKIFQIHSTDACKAPLLHNICQASRCQFAHSQLYPIFSQILAILRCHPGCYQWHPRQLLPVCRRAQHVEELQRRSHTELPRCMFL